MKEDIKAEFENIDLTDPLQSLLEETFKNPFNKTAKGEVFLTEEDIADLNKKVQEIITEAVDEAWDNFKLDDGSEVLPCSFTEIEGILAYLKEYQELLSKISPAQESLKITELKQCMYKLSEKLLGNKYW
jgi:hypothetical protein